MAQPVTTTDILLQEVAGLLTEIRDLLRERPAATSQQKQPAAKKPTPKAASSRAKASK